MPTMDGLEPLPQEQDAAFDWHPADVLAALKKTWPFPGRCFSGQRLPSDRGRQGVEATLAGRGGIDRGGPWGNARGYLAVTLPGRGRW